VVLAGLINALKVVRKKKEKVKVVINGAGAAGSGIAEILNTYGFKNVVLCDRSGIISRKRRNLTSHKKYLLKISNKSNISGTLQEALEKADIFIGVSQGNLLTPRDIREMNKDAIIFALANPTPEIMPSNALAGGAKVVATGRSDFPNQVNNVLAYPGIFKGALDGQARKITEKMKVAAALALANIIKNPTADRIIPDPFDKRVVPAVANAVKKIAKR